MEEERRAKEKEVGFLVSVFYFFVCLLIYWVVLFVAVVFVAFVLFLYLSVITWVLLESNMRSVSTWVTSDTLLIYYLCPYSTAHLSLIIAIFSCASAKLKEWVRYKLKMFHISISEFRVVFQMKILKAKQEEDRKRLEEQFKADKEAQRYQMHNMMTANMDVLRKDREAILQQNQTFKEMMERMQQLMDERNDLIVELQKQIIALLKRPPSPPPKEGICVIS